MIWFYYLIVFSRTYGEPQMFTLFYLKYSPENYYTNPNLVRYQAYNWIWVNSFDKFYFPDLGDPGTNFTDVVVANKGKKMLFVGKPIDFPANLPRLLRINFLDGTGAFDLVESK